jgi:hypothetical protein
LDVLTAAWAVVAAGLAYKFGSRVVRGGRPTDEALRRLASALGLEVTHGWGGDRVLEGEVSGFSTIVRVERHAPILAQPGESRAVIRAVISIDARMHVSSALWLAAGHGADLRLMRKLGTGFVRTSTGDSAFDAQMICGTWWDASDDRRADPATKKRSAEVLSVLDSMARLAIRAAADRGDLCIGHGWIEGVVEIPEAKALAGDAKAALDALVGAARAIFAPMSEVEIQRRLSRNAIDDPIVAVRKRCLELLIERCPSAIATKTAVEAALSSRVPELELVAALFLDDPPARQALRALAGSSEAPPWIRAQALFHLAATDPLANADVFEHALASESDDVQLAAIGGLGQLELRLIPIDLFLEAAPRLGPLALEALLDVFDRVDEEEGDHLPDATRARMIALLERFDENGYERSAHHGRLSIAAPRPDEGALSVSDAAKGDVAFPPEES